MIIANPIYDVVFKYLLEDAEIARGFLSTILGVDIIDLKVKPQETVVKDETGGIKIFHLDFKALIKSENGEEKTVLIELQKAKKSQDILRFRKYLGDNYSKEEIRKNSKGELEGYAVEIVTIYILGYKLKGVNVPVLRVSRNFTDAITQEVVEAENEFITKLTHESFTIQIPRLRSDQRNKLEEVLEIFKQDYITDDLHKFEFDKSTKNPLLKKMIKRLSKAASDEAIKRTMDAEDMFERVLNRELNAQLEQQAMDFKEMLLKKEVEKAEALKLKEVEKAEALKLKDAEKAEALKLKEVEKAEALRLKEVEKEAEIAAALKQKDAEMKELKRMIEDLKNQKK